MALPSGYTKLEYIAASGGQYINTGFAPNQNTRVVIDCWRTGATSVFPFPFGSRAGLTHGLDAAIGASQVFYHYGGNYQFADFSAAGNRMTIDANKNVATFASNGVSTTITLAAATFQESYGITLFSLIESGSVYTDANAFVGNIYSCKIYDNGTLVRDYIPCKNASGVVGMWDDANGQFYTNAGTGAFTAGPEVKPDLTAHKTLVGGTAYTVQGGKCMVDGTVYNILKGRTLIDGTGWDITFPSALAMPVKGDLITMNLDGTDRLYRVLKIVDGTTVEVFRVKNLDTLVRYSGTAEYAGNNIDVALNQTYYNTLTTAAKNAIVAKDINQYSYANRGSYSNDHVCSLYYPENKWLRWHVGNRFVYALDLEDVEEYFNSKYTSDDINAIFFQDFTGMPGYKRLWLRSASSSDDSMAICISGGLYASVIQMYYYNNYGVLPTFQIDLSKIDFTIGGA